MQDLLETVVRLRFAVGLLGEQAIGPWWPSRFLATSSEHFLAPAFPRLPVLARYHGVVAAAAGVHDDHIGVGHV